MQWKVTAYGLEAVKPDKYDIPKNRLLEIRPGETDIADWPLHMADKGWVVLSDFWQAWQAAVRRHHGTFGPVNLEKTERAMRALRG